MDIVRHESDTEVACSEGEFLIRVMAPDETEETYGLIKKEEWNVTLSKFKAICNVFPSCTFVTVKKETKEVIAVTTAIPTHPGQFVVGNVVVRHDHRKQGHGTKMLELIRDKHVGDTLTLTAVPGADAFYSRIGFRVIEPIHHVYYMEVDRVKVDNAFINSHIDGGVSVDPYTKDMFPALNAYDTTARGYDCGKYLSVMTNTSSLFLVATSQTSGQIVGYAGGVDDSDLLWMDGVYADSDAIALHVFRNMLQAFPQRREVLIQTIKPREFIVGFGNVLEKSRTCTPMARGLPVPVSSSKLYAVTGFCYAE